MDKFFKFGRLFVLGFLLAFITANLTMCPEESATNPSEPPPVETEQVKQFNTTVKTAFESGDKSAVINLMYEDYQDIYGEMLNKSTADMQAFAKALENRKLIFANELYAEYEITIDGNVYTIAYSNNGDNIWKLHRF